MIKTKSMSCLLLLAFTACATGQQAISNAPQPTPSTNSISQVIETSEVEKHIRFLASDALKGRDTGSAELEIAARYLAEHFRAWGAEPAPGMDDYLQQVPFKKVSPHKAGNLSLAGKSFTLGRDFMPRSGGNGSWSGSWVYLPYASAEEVAQHDVANKWVISRAGAAPNAAPQAQYFATFTKQKLLQEAGAKGLIEVYNDSQLGWPQIKGYLGGEQMELREESEAHAADFVSLWLAPQDKAWWKTLEAAGQETMQLSLSGKEELRLNSPNVLAVIPGTDPQLRSEYLVLSAHYDHVGIGQPVKGDSIYNGARDNAVGTTAVLMAGQYFAKNPAKRSVLLALWTAEEQGLLGSQYFIENSPLPLKQMIYNLNIDGAGYNDTTKVTVVGLERTTAEQLIREASMKHGLTAIQDPVPEQNLFDRSDNVHFAKAGIPAPTYSMGLTAFDAEIGKYYHQPADEADKLNYPYVSRYIRGFTETAEQIANASERPFWVAGDKYEAAGKALYQQ